MWSAHGMAYVYMGWQMHNDEKQVDLVELKSSNNFHMTFFMCRSFSSVLAQATTSLLNIEGINGLFDRITGFFKSKYQDNAFSKMVIEQFNAPKGVKVT